MNIVDNIYAFGEICKRCHIISNDEVEKISHIVNSYDGIVVTEQMMNRFNSLDIVNCDTILTTFGVRAFVVFCTIADYYSSINNYISIDTNDSEVIMRKIDNRDKFYELIVGLE